MPQTIPESKATNKHCREVWLHLQAAMTFSTALHVPSVGLDEVIEGTH